MRIYSVLICLMFSILSADPSEKLELGGYLESGMTCYDGSDQTTAARAAFRLEGDKEIGASGKIEAHLIYHYDMKPLDPFVNFKENSIYSRLVNNYFQLMYGDLDAEERMIADRLLEIYSSGYFDYISYSSFYPKETIVLDRALIKLYAGPFDITFGKQQIAWGTGYAFNPTDVWNIKNPVDPEAPKIGVIAANISYYFGENSSLQAIVSPGSRPDLWKYGLRLKSTAGRYEYSLSAVRDKTDDAVLLGIPEKLQLGADLSGETFAEIGVHAEAALFNPRYNGMETSDTDSAYVQLCAGFDYTFDWGAYVLGEYYYNGLGRKEHSDTDIVSFSRITGGEMSGLSRNYTALMISYELAEDLNFSLTGISNLDDASSVIVPELEYTFHENILVKLSSSLFAGDSSSTEYGGMFSSVAFRITGFF